MLGEYGEGFALYDGRFERARGRVPKAPLRYPQWRGENLTGKSLLIWPEQGFGDQIMFARFVPALVERGARVTVLTQPALVRLFQHLPATILGAAGQLSIPRHDYWTMPGSIPGPLGITQATLPSAPYLPGRPGGNGIGIVVRGDPGHANDRNRSLPLELATELLTLPSAVSLLPEDTGAQDFQATADRIADLEMVVTVDTSIAHLAGAMGKRTWVLVPEDGLDWRWMRGRSDSPWYPSVRLFRRPLGQDWKSTVREVRGLLSAH